MEKWRSRFEAVRVAEDVQTLGECCECVRGDACENKVGLQFLDERLEVVGCRRGGKSPVRNKRLVQ